MEHLSKRRSPIKSAPGGGAGEKSTLPESAFIPVRIAVKQHRATKPSVADEHLRRAERPRASTSMGRRRGNSFHVSNMQFRETARPDGGTSKASIL